VSPTGPRFCKVALPLPLKEAFDYRVPEGLELQPGQRVQVPFGKRRLAGVVTQLLEQSAVPGLKAVDKALDERPSVSRRLLEFTRWLADYYLCGWGEALALALPQPGLKPGERELSAH
jgi:primosomal protein N' (replication factor Y) (superfamily II helicase)